MYVIIATRKQLLRYAKLSANEQKYACPITLAPLYAPISIRGSSPLHTFSGPILDELTKTNKVDPLNEMPLTGEWMMEDFQMDKDLSQLEVTVPLANGAYSEKIKFCDLGMQAASLSQLPKFEVTFQLDC